MCILNHVHEQEATAIRDRDAAWKKAEIDELLRGSREEIAGLRAELAMVLADNRSLMATVADRNAALADRDRTIVDLEQMVIDSEKHATRAMRRPGAFPRLAAESGRECGEGVGLAIHRFDAGDCE